MGENDKNKYEQLLDSKERYRKIVQAGIAKWVKDFQEGNIQIRTVDDLRKLIEMDHELLLAINSIKDKSKHNSPGGGR